LVEEIKYIKTNKKLADRTAYNALINDHLDNNIFPCS